MEKSPGTFNDKYFNDRGYFVKCKDPKKEELAVQSLLGKVPEGGCVLDLGCGVGKLNIQLNRSGFRSYGLDISMEGLLSAKHNIDEAGVGIVPLSQGEAFRLPFKDGVVKMDVVG